MADSMIERPEHPDFWRLARIVSRHDDMTDAGGPFQELVERLGGTPLEVVQYLAFQRALRVVRNRGGNFGVGVADQRVALASATWIDGFLSGVSFEKERDEEKTS